MIQKNQREPYTLRLHYSSSSDTTLLMTPFVDVIFLITIFFVLTSAFSFLNIIKIDLPASETAQAELSEPMVVTIDDAGNVFVNQQKVSDESFISVFTDTRQNLGDVTTTVLNAYRLTPLERIITIMDRIRLAGITEISVHTIHGP